MTGTTTSHLMKIADEHGSVLTGRSLAAEIAAELALRVADRGTVTVDFHGVEAMSPSFADELFGKLWAHVDSDTVVLQNVNDHVAGVAHMMKRNRQLAPLGSAANLALRSLNDHPQLRTPGAIANGPYGVDQLAVDDYINGLAELEARGFAVRVAGGWRLTPSGQTAAGS